MDGRRRRERLWRAVAAWAEAPEREPGWAQEVCLSVVAEFRGVDAATLSLWVRGERAQEILGASDAWAAGLAETQYTVGEGPGMEALRGNEPVLVPDLRVDQQRWPGYAEEALAAGVAAVFVFPLQVGALRLGTLELFRHHVGELGDDESTDAVLTADLVAAGLLRQADLAERAGQVYEPRLVTSFHDVNVATGMLAARLRIDLDDAFARLRAHAFGHGRSVLDVARDVIERRIALDDLAE
ncbi:GAF and ANTAR domain-containing protein [Amycolatopsis magusensis]|uniref:GAF and ANTAR domain-containing protein n=1 Tax=Amycolatopsis magusensis TaxID=882444 RepID=UPI0024A9C9BB|nr:GAF and ANTAR domain-containing protein [Amycolatopsis magusensis]MDI5980664.1 GAF and ANTAR domain-containing protein [Amycolatopsis magusensis]